MSPDSKHLTWSARKPAKLTTVVKRHWTQTSCVLDGRDGCVVLCYSECMTALDRGWTHSVSSLYLRLLRVRFTLPHAGLSSVHFVHRWYLSLVGSRVLRRRVLPIASGDAAQERGGPWLTRGQRACMRRSGCLVRGQRLRGSADQHRCTRDGATAATLLNSSSGRPKCRVCLRSRQGCRIVALLPARTLLSPFGYGMLQALHADAGVPLRGGGGGGIAHVRSNQLRCKSHASKGSAVRA